MCSGLPSLKQQWGDFRRRSDLSGTAYKKIIQKRYMLAALVCL